MFKHRIAALCILLACSSAVTAQDLFVYPKNDQSAEQQQKDQSECYVWAKNQSGFDPADPPTSSAPPPADTAPDGSVVRGAARGALLGEIIDNDAGTGAAAGAAIGAMRRRDRMRNENAERERYQQQEAARLAEMHDRYNRAFKGCMEARDYSIS